jgi:hypothetical protein
MTIITNGVISKGLTQSSIQILHPFPQWKYFIIDISQFANGTIQHFSLRIFFDTSQPNFQKRLSKFTIGQYVTIICDCQHGFIDDESRIFSLFLY